jgi:antitoxin MazE
MRTRVVAIGNSRGIRLPKAVLDQCRIEEDVELEIENETIVIRPLKKIPREGWAAAFQEMSDRSDDLLLIDERLDLNLKEWEW